ncbi:leucine-rich single-pass membrane protein 1-like isoform X2 [Narcine bancroftii]|uniref:leucine-rich single-pass membrane protein 1-like isoform X2 n=1 Tax=Narcine bancroftii TaxID=1343680 RepID=UPI003831BC9A
MDGGEEAAGRSLSKTLPPQILLDSLSSSSSLFFAPGFNTLQMKMQNGFKDLTLFDLDGDSKLYVVDSINNLHRTNTCDDPFHPPLNSVECDSISENIKASTKELINDNGKKEPQADPPTIKSTENIHVCSLSHFQKKLLFAAVTFLLLVSFALAAFAITFIVRMDNQLDYILAKINAEGKQMKENKNLVTDHLNFSKESNNSDITGIFHNQTP